MSQVKHLADLSVARKALGERTKAHFALFNANRAAVKLPATDPRYIAATSSLDEAILNLTIGKWVLGRALGTHAGFAATTGDVSDYELSIERFGDAIAKAEWVQGSLETESNSDSASAPATHHPWLSKGDTEIFFADGVPVVPSICPIIILEGTSFEMGHQYATQAIEIYGEWIFAEAANRIFSAAESTELRKWETEVLRYTPEISEMAKGWAAGATEAGVPMEYDNALAIWTGAQPPNTELRGTADDLWSDDLKDLMPSAPSVAARGLSEHVGGTLDELCSGLAAWGEGTEEGGLVVGASTDHDCTFQATVVAFPDDGNNFIYTPFGVNGRIPGWSNLFMAGHPGLNSEGLAYVHHGCIPYVGDPQEEWGYGVRRGAGTFHLLRYAGSAKEALEKQLSWPVGDAGQAMGTDGGFYADKDYSYVLEARKGTEGEPVLREHSVGADGKEYDFLYANNNSISEKAPQIYAVPEVGYDHDSVGGWYAHDQDVLLRGTPGEQWRKMCTKLSEPRNRFLFEKLSDGYGDIDTSMIQRLYSTPGEFPEGEWNEIVADYEKGQWDGSAAHRVNAFISIIDGEMATYSGCIGPLRRDVMPNNPSHGFYYFDETNASWKIALAETPAAVVADARNRAKECVDEAAERLLNSDLPGETQNELARLLAVAREELGRGVELVDDGADGEGVSAQSRALRFLTRAQVRANQVTNGIDPVPAL